MLKPAEESVIKRLLRGVKWNMVMAVGVAAGNLLTAIVAARLLGLEGFGAFSIVRSTVYMMVSVAGLGLGLTATRHIADMKTTQPERLGRVLGLCELSAWGGGIFFALMFLILAPEIAEWSLNAPQVTGQLRLAAMYILFVTVNFYQIGVLTGFEAFLPQAKISFVQALVSLGLTAGLTWWLGLDGAALSLGLAAVTNWLFYQVAIRAELRNWNVVVCYRNLKHESGVLSGFALPAALAAVIGALTMWSGNACLVRQTDGLAQMAIFTAAGNIRSMIMFVPDLVTRVASPILCSMAGEQNRPGYSKIFWLNLSVAAGASLAAAIFFTLFGSWLMAFFGRSFSEAGTAIIFVVAAGTVVEVIANTLYQPLYVHDRLWWQVIIVSAWGLVLNGVVATTAAVWGALGLAAAYLAAHLLSAALYVLAIIRLEKGKT